MLAVAAAVGVDVAGTGEGFALVLVVAAAVLVERSAYALIVAKKSVAVAASWAVVARCFTLA